MDQGCKRLPLLVVLLFWKNADGFKGGAYSSAHHGWDQPSDTSMSEVHVTGILPVEEVGSSLFPNKALKSKSKLNLLQSVKGGSSSYQSMSHAQTAPSSFVSASLPLSLNQQPSSSLASSGSTVPGVAGGLSLETQYAASGSGQVVSTLGESSSYPAQLGVSGQSTSDTLYVSSSRETPVKLAEASLPVFSKTISYSSSSAPGATSTSQRSPALLSESSGQSVSSQGEVGYSGLSQGASSRYTPGSLMASKLYSLPLGVSSQSASVQNSPSVSMSGTQLATFSHFIPVQGGSSSVSLSLKPQGTLGQYAPASHTKYASAPMSAPQATTNRGSSYRAVSQVGSLPQMGASGPFTSQGGNYYRRLFPQSQATSSQYALGYSKPISSPQRTSSQFTSVLNSRKQYSSASQGSSGAQFGASTGFAPQGMSSSYSGSVQSQGTTSQSAPGSQSYASVSLSSPQAGPYTTVQGSRKQLPSTYTGGSGSQAGSSTRFSLHGTTAYGGSSQPQDTASQFVPGSSFPYASVSLLSPQGVASQSSQAYQGYSVSQRWQPSATRWTQAIQTPDAASSQGSSSSQSSPMQFSSLSSAGGSSSRVSGQFVSEPGDGTSYGGPFQSQSLSTKYTPGFQLLPYDPSVAGQGTSSASEVLSSHSSVNNQNAPAQPSRSSSSSHFYSIKG